MHIRDLISAKYRAVQPETGGCEMKKWSKPSFQNMRYGFEINLYVRVR
jgi:coenzyme PQQ precursor peptide PqqA